MALDHFSHDHPLMLISEVRTEEGAEEEVLCYGCQKPILSSAYSCSKCNYFLHEKCAELQGEIKHPKHSEHPLTLYSRPPYRSSECICNVCDIYGWKWFTYHCSICEFDVHVGCALEESVVEHESHPLHPLTVMHRKSSFKCDACGIKAEDVSLLCSICEFWIHKSCASCPRTIEHSDHDHPLVLNYFFPYENRSFRYDCDICGKKVQRTEWLYGCDRCRYYAHIKCVTSGQTESSRGEKGDIIAYDPNTMIQFPLTAEGLINLLGKLLNEVTLAGKERAPEIDHFGHVHPLILFDDQSMPITEEEEVLCDCCIQPITSSPFYGCSQCSYFLHTSCTMLPDELQHPSHTEHVLKLYAPESFVHIIRCNGCLSYGNGFYYKCETCNYCLDISCAFFPKIIKHEGHKHPMQLKLNYKDFEGLQFACDACNFVLSISVVGCPATVKHDWDKHPLTLSYPPYSDHPDRFYCEVCEEEMYPKHWACRSRNRIHFYHWYCAIPYDEYSKTKFAGTLKVENHPHTLKFVRKSKNKSPSLCNQCDKDFEGEPVMECAPCNFVTCRECCEDII